MKKLDQRKKNLYDDIVRFFKERRESDVYQRLIKALSRGADVITGLLLSEMLFW